MSSPVNVKQAVTAAKAAALDFYGEELRDLRLEEVETPVASSDWKVTLSFLFPEKNPPRPGFNLIFQDPLTRPYERVYKAFIVDSTTGQIKAMRIRET
jgi:hypothetical protein